jgi:hypothetical protein
LRSRGPKRFAARNRRNPLVAGTDWRALGAR